MIIPLGCAQSWRKSDCDNEVHNRGWICIVVHNRMHEWLWKVGLECLCHDQVHAYDHA